MRFSIIREIMIMFLIFFLPLKGLTKEYPDITIYHVNGSNPGMALCLDGDYLYLAGTGMLSVYNVKDNPETPELIGRLHGLPFWECRQIAVSRGYAYITARSQGLWVIDVSNPKKLRLCQVCDTIELATGIEISGDVLFVAERIYGVEVFDISQPERPQHVALFRTFEAQSLFCQGTLLAVGNWGNSMVDILDVSDPSKPKTLSAIKLDGFGDGVYIDQNILYAATGHHARKGTREERFGHGHGLEIFDISNSEKPKRLGGVKFPPLHQLSHDYWTCKLTENSVFAIDSFNGLFKVDVKDKQNPVIIGRAILPNVDYNGKELPESIGGLAVGNGVVYFSGDKTGLYFIKEPGVSPETKKTETLKFEKKQLPAEIKDMKRYDCGGMVRRLALHGDFLYAAVSEAGLKTYRIFKGKDKIDLREIYSTSAKNVYDVSVSGNLLATAEGSELVLYQLGENGIPVRLGGYKSPTPVQIVHLYQNGKIAVFTGGSGRVTFVDLQNPANPVLLKNFAEKRILYCDSFPASAIVDRLPLTAHGAGISWYKLAQGHVERVSQGLMPDKKLRQTDGITRIMDDYFLLPVNDGSYILLPPDAEGELRYCQADKALSGMPTWNGKNKIAFSNRRDGTVSLFNISAPDKLNHIQLWDFKPGTPDRVVFVEDKMIIPAGYSGIYVWSDKQIQNTITQGK